MLQTERQAETDAELAISPFEQIEREVVIVPEIASNSLVVSATPRYYERIKKLIEDLDERPPMVLIQVLIGEVRLNDTDQFGVELGLQDSLLFDRSLLGELTTTTNTTTTQSAGGATVTTEQQIIQNAPGNPGFNFNNPNAPLGNNLSDRSLAERRQRGRSGVVELCGEPARSDARLQRFRVLGLERRGEHPAAGAAGKSAAGSVEPAAAHGPGWSAGLRAGRPGRADDHRHARSIRSLARQTRSNTGPSA